MTKNLTVDVMANDPTFIKEHILADLDRSFLEEAIFRNGGENQGVVAWNDDPGVRMIDDAEVVAEFAEIPLSDVEDGQIRSAVGRKIALGLAVSLEDRRFNRLDKLNKRILALKNTLVASSVQMTLKAFKEADIQTLSVGKTWDKSEANPFKDLSTAKRMIATAKPEGATDRKWNFRADTLVIPESTLELGLTHQTVQNIYRGDAAIENPLYKGILPQTLHGLRVVTSSWLEEDEVYVMQSQTAGFYSDGIPLTVTDLYSPNGQNDWGGSTQSWRLDAFMNRIVVVDAPKAVVKLQGVV